ncbi:MAG: GTPase, partial [Aquificaceae bacterium]
MSNRVLILGRPNVGKSMLFNRILGRRKSIVYDLPGVTRDFLEAEASWKGRSFVLVDSGGIWERIQKKVQEAISKAHIVLFVVDGREGLTATDEYIAKLLYPHKEKVFLIVNKIDNERLEKNVYEFFALGFQRVFSVSSQHGRNIGELLDAIYPLLEEKPAKLDYSGIKVSFVGRVNVGKSSLINALLNEERVLVSPVAGTTRDAVEIPFVYKNKS